MFNVSWSVSTTSAAAFTLMPALSKLCPSAVSNRWKSARTP